MIEQKYLDADFLALHHKKPTSNDVFMRDGDSWVYVDNKWQILLSPPAVESMVCHIKSLENILKTACKFTISPKTKKDVIVSREKDSTDGYYYEVNHGYNAVVDRDLKLRTSTYAIKEQPEFKAATRYNSLYEAYSIAEQYMDTV